MAVWNHKANSAWQTNRLTARYQQTASSESSRSFVQSLLALIVPRGVIVQLEKNQINCKAFPKLKWFMRVLNCNSNKIDFSFFFFMCQPLFVVLVKRNWKCNFCTLYSNLPLMRLQFKSTSKYISRVKWGRSGSNREVKFKFIQPLTALRARYNNSFDPPFDSVWLKLFDREQWNVSCKPFNRCISYLFT